MRVPLKWLKEYVDYDLPTPELAHRLTLAGLEVDHWEVYGRPAWATGLDLTQDHLDWEHIAVGRVLEVKPHPNADRLRIAMVDDGEGPQQSVTGAPNLALGSSGQRVALARPGARIVNAYGDDPARVKVKPAKLRGERSEVVLCSEKELGLSDDHEGILLLDPDAPVGAPLSEVLGEVVLELELTPNLARCLNLVGIAREVAALTGGTFKAQDPDWRPEGPPVEGAVRVEIEEPALCARYTAAVIRGVCLGSAPAWMRHRLTLAGMRPINVIVDITNYVMLEWGQPLHAFDYRRLQPRKGEQVPTIGVRRARPGETLVTLDEVERRLDEDVLLITDGQEPIGLAGVMGGRDSEISATTRDILLESATFNAPNNRRTAQKLKLFSEASARFSKGLPPELAERGLKRAAELMRTLAGGTIDRGFVDARPRPAKPVTVSLPLREPERLLGLELSPERIVTLLEPLGFTCEPEDGALRVRVPYYRLDVSRPADLVEEIARMVGYDQLPSRLLADVLPPQRRHRALEGGRRIKALLTQLGLCEVINYSLTHSQLEARLGARPPAEPFVELANPLSSERSVLRRSLLPGLVETAARNRRTQERIALFELGHVFLPREGQRLPREPGRLGLLLWGRREVTSWLGGEGEVDFFDLKGVVQGLLEALGITGASFAPVAAPGFHPGRCAALVVEGERLGVLGELHPQTAEAFALEGRVCAAELELEALLAGLVTQRAYHPLPRFPAVWQDLALVVEAAVPTAQIEELIQELGQPLLSEVGLFDVYTGPPVPEDKRSLAYTLTYQAPDRTLSSEEVQAVHARIGAGLRERLGAQVRGVDA